MNASRYCADTENKSLKKLLAEDRAGNEKRPRKNHRFKPWIVWTLVIILIVILIASLFLVLPLINKKAGHTALIRIPAKATEQMVRDSISKYLGEDYADNCMKAMVIIDGSEHEYRHGAYRIEEGMTPFSAARQITRGGQAGIDVKLNGQRTKEDVAKLLASKLEASEEDFLKAFEDTQILDKYRTDPDHVLCLFFEDTYEFYWTATPEDVIKKMYENYNDFWTPERVQRAEGLKLLPRGVYTIASIVDAETNQSSEKGTIGMLYINRLNQNMPLQADPTLVYAMGDFSITRVTSEMKSVDSPFNTYKYKGLPPGPIRLTSAKTMDAILTARPHDYLFMCASDKMDGTHNFTVTLEEHNQNAKRYQQKQDELGNTVDAQNEKLKKAPK
ncbi:MAG: endolytic transglycosylase MltG [Muribaculaceae bacterium]|nr:endolytic transglycosylase MltG [Muribaculaceae bacterium]